MSGAVAGPALPVPCATGACGAGGPTKLLTGGAATAVATPNALTVNQTSNSAILNWSSFNIGAGGSVVFKQPGTSAIALNRIFQGSPSQIFGNLSANGQIYLLNLNGFLFGSTARVNVGGLIASSLPLSLSDADFGKGILAPLQNGAQAVFNANLDPLAPGGRTSVLDVNGQPVLGADGKPLTVQVVVQPGAQLTAADQGRLMLTGQNVTNGGSLTAPDGQVILAAGTQVFLQADTDPGLRGLVVEVDGAKTTAADGTVTTNSAWNQLGGLLSAPRGNVWMVGLAVNQDGRVSATTSVAANGSIRLEAAGNAGFGSGNGVTTVFSTQGGALTIGPKSQMDISTDASSGTAVAAQTQLPSTITLLGEQVVLQGGAIDAPGGTLTAVAAVNPSNGATGTADPNARLRIDPGVSIDLSGSLASLPVTANLVSAQLRSSELADDPTQRTGPLHGLTVYFDPRNGSPPIANLSGEIAGVPQTIAQRTEAGGHAIFQSEGDAVFAKGASIDVSGGSATYAGGVLQDTYLVGTNGQLYSIATADPLLSYTGVVNPTFTRTFNTWGVQDVVPTPGLSAYQPGYVQGAAAGSIQFAAPNLVLQGTLAGAATNGVYQRTPATAVPGAALIIGVPGGVTTTQFAIDYLSPEVRVTPTPTPIVVADDASLPGPLTLDLPEAYLTSSGFSSTAIFSNFGVTLPAGTPLVLPGGSSLTVSAARADILSSITDPGGTLQFQNVFNIGSAAATGVRPGVFLGDGVTLNVDGLWTNDRVTANVGTHSLPSTWQNAGSINLGVASNGAMLSLGDEVSLEADGGAWFQASGTVTAGTGGAITLNAGGIADGLAVGKNLAVSGFGVNGSKGGTFSLTAPRVEVGAVRGSGWTPQQVVDDALPATSSGVLPPGAPAPMAPGGTFKLYADLFSDFGFQTVNLTANGLVPSGAGNSNVLTVDPGTVVDARVRTLELAGDAALRPSSAGLAGVASVALLPSYLQPSEHIALNALPVPAGANTASSGTAVGDVSIGTGASISTAAGGTIAITGLDSIVVDGGLRAPGGSVSLEVLAPGSSGSKYGDYEVGFLPGQRIELGSTGSIDVAGSFIQQPSTAGLSLGTLSAGGTVNLFADRGAVITDGGSRISIAGLSAALDVLQPTGAYGHEIASSAGGTMTVRSGEAISLLGAIQASAGSGGTSGAAAGGALEVDLTRYESWWGVATPGAAATFNQSPLILELEPTVPGTVPPSLANSNQALLGAAQLTQSGVDALRLESGSVIELSSNFSLNLGRQIILDAPVIAANTQAKATLSAPYLEVGYQTVSLATAANHNSATTGTGTLNFSGSEIDLLGTTVFQGASNVSFVSSGDLKLRGIAAGPSVTALAGGVTVAGNLNLDAERIYPTTATSFAINAVEDPSVGIPGRVSIGQTGASPGTPYSVDGALSISAYSVNSTGTLYAPFGSIALNATNGVTLGDGSLTSVSGDGLILPFGATQFAGSQWTYLFANVPQVISSVPTRAVSLTGPTVAIAPRATINLSGGGDLSAYEWVPGPGGSTDALAAGKIPGLYAILPSTRGQASPQDPQSNDSTISAGESVYLSGGYGLAAGTYPLLPARYGLLPGAFLIQAEPNFQSTGAGTLGALKDGTPVIAGFLSYGSTGLHQTPGYTGFALYPGSYGTRLASYGNSLASAFFSAAASAADEPRPTLPADAGSLSIAVTRSLDAAGHVLTAAAAGGLAAPIEISASDLVIGTPTGSVPADAVSVSGDALNSWQPGSLLLGGTLTSVTSGATTTAGSDMTSASSIDVLANSVTVGAGTKLAAGEIILVANSSVDVQNGATLQSTSATSTTPPMTPPPQQAVTLTGSPNPAFLAVSDLNWLIPLRTAGSSPSGAGTVAIDKGATLATRGSLTVDGIGGAVLNGTLTGPGAEWSLGSSSIAFAPPGATTDAMSISAGLLANLESAGAVRVASTGSLDIESPVNLGVGAGGSPALGSLILQASSINNLTGAGATAGVTSTQFGAKTLTLQGSGAASGVPGEAGPAGATLSLVAGQLNVGPGALDINGFASTRVAATGAVVGQGSGALYVGGDLTLAAAGITAATAANTTLGATGALSVAANGGGAVPHLLGGALTLSGSSLDVSGSITAPAGSVSLNALNDLTVEAGAVIGAAGAVVAIENQTAAAPAGSIMASAGGNLILKSGAILDVSGAGSAAAGAISLTAGQSASLGASLEGRGGQGAAGGSFSLDAGMLAAPSGSNANPLSLLAASLGPTTPGRGGFTNAIDLRVRNGDLTLDSSSSLTANAVTLSADAGTLTVAGQIFAPSGALRGKLSIFGGNGVELTGGAALHADGAGPSGLGGSIEIGAGRLIADSSGNLDLYNTAVIALDAGSTISAAGAAGEGTLLLRAPALLASDDIAISTFAANTSAVGHIIVEPVLPFNTGTGAFSSATAPTTADFQSIGQTVATYMAAAGPGIAARLGSNGGTPLTVEAGVEIVAPGALTLPATGLDLSSAGLNWQFGGAPVDLTIRAAGGIEVAGTVSDGFLNQVVGDDGVGLLQPTLLSGPSASIRLVAGADLTSANPLASAVGGTTAAPRDLIIDPGMVVRTGTGDIDLVAAGNLKFMGAGSGAYTAGVPAIAPGGSQAIPYPGVDPGLGTTAPNSDNDANQEVNNFGVFVVGTPLLTSFPTGGGNLTVRAGGDIDNLSPTSPGAVTTWQLRQSGNGAATPDWGVNLLAYHWNLGTLGGGDLNISAGGSAINVSAAAADSLLPQAAGATPAYVKGGGLAFDVGKDVGSAQVYVADGVGSVAAGGALTATLPAVDGVSQNAGSAFYLQSSAINVTARLGAVIDGIYNSTALVQAVPPGVTIPPPEIRGAFFSYGDHSALNVQSAAGDIVLGNSSNAAPTLLGAPTAVANSGGALSDFPASLSLGALSGNVMIRPAIGSPVLYPSPSGQLDLLAAQDIVGNGTVGGGRLTMADSPVGNTVTGAPGLTFNLHLSDSQPALVTAGGNIQDLSLGIPKATIEVAGRDIVNQSYLGQNLNPKDETLFSAGRDFSEPSGGSISVGGPGRLDVIAGRNISLGFSQGVVTTGNLVNANLPTSQGADIAMVTGLGTSPDVAAFLQQIVGTPAGKQSGYQQQLIDYVQTLDGSSGLTFAEAQTAFGKLGIEQQRPLIDSVFFNELSLSGLAANTVPGAGFSQGYRAIDTLFPGSRSGTPKADPNAFAGDLTLQFSRIYTLSGGNITLVVPGGGIDVGLANPPSTLASRPASSLGIVTEGPGNIDIYARNDVNVNSSRIFTLGGGNILIWSDEGSIDAGLGAKTSLSAPPPSILINSNGTVTVNFSGAATGSGIRTIQTEPTTPAGDVNLIAPVGSVNAGDAGIGAAGNINIAARSVIGVTNINFGGTATGVPATVSNVSASLSGASNAASGASNAATNAVNSDTASKESAAPLAQSALSWLDVFVTGLGEENCKPDDIECLKRQKTPAH